MALCGSLYINAPLVGGFSVLLTHVGLCAMEKIGAHVVTLRTETEIHRGPLEIPQSIPLLKELS